MKTGLKHYENKDISNFTSYLGVKFRKVIHPLIRNLLLNVGTKKDIHIEKYPVLDENKKYIFVSTHSFCEDIVTAIASTVPHAYALIGTKDQLEHNPLMHIANLSGFIYVDRNDPESRRQSVLKMVKTIVYYDTNIILFLEGGLNNTESSPLQQLFNGATKVSNMTKTEVVPLCSYQNPETREIFVSVEEPIKLYEYDKDEGKEKLRSIMGITEYELMLEHAPYRNRSKLGSDPRHDYMEERREEYATNKWYTNASKDELTRYKDKRYPLPEDVRKELANVKITKENFHLIAPIFKDIIEDNKYDIKKYLTENWPVNKNVKKRIKK